MPTYKYDPLFPDQPEGRQQVVAQTAGQIDSTEVATDHPYTGPPEVVEKDGGEISVAARYKADVTDIAPTERKTLECTADAAPGIYLIDCHKVDHVMNGDNYPGGMLTALVYESAMDTEQFADVMDMAGYDG